MAREEVAARGESGGACFDFFDGGVAYVGDGVVVATVEVDFKGEDGE